MKENIDKFLKTFKDLEKYLRINSNKFQEQEYTRKLSQSNNKLIKNGENGDLLYQAGKLRNILSHNNEVAAPTELFLETFIKLVSKIVSPKNAYDIMVKYNNCLLASPEERILPTLVKMKDNKISSVPIVVDKKVVGIFNETSLFHTFLDENGEMVVDLKGVTFNDHIENFNLDKTTYFAYKFISRDTDVYKCFHEFELGYKDDVKVELLFVTENGDSKQALLGLVSIFDLINEIQ